MSRPPFFACPENASGMHATKQFSIRVVPHSSACEAGQITTQRHTPGRGRQVVSAFFRLCECALKRPRAMSPRQRTGYQRVPPFASKRRSDRG
jgi:hypothetical protein